MSGLINDVNTTSSKEKGTRPVFNVKLSPYAAGNKNMAAITFSGFDPDYIKKYVGTKENPGPLYGQDISKFTLFYDNSLNTVFKKEAEVSNITPILKVQKNYTIDSFPKAGKINLSYDDETNEVNVVYHKKVYINGQPRTQDIPYNSYNLEDINAVESQLLQILKDQEARNLAAEDAIREINKNK